MVNEYGQGSANPNAQGISARGIQAALEIPTTPYTIKIGFAQHAIWAGWFAATPKDHDEWLEIGYSKGWGGDPNITTYFYASQILGKYEEVKITVPVGAPGSFPLFTIVLGGGTWNVAINSTVFHQFPDIFPGRSLEVLDVGGEVSSLQNIITPSHSRDLSYFTNKWLPWGAELHATINNTSPENLAFAFQSLTSGLVQTLRVPEKAIINETTPLESLRNEGGNTEPHMLTVAEVPSYVPPAKLVPQQHAVDVAQTAANVYADSNVPVVRVGVAQTTHGVVSKLKENGQNFVVHDDNDVFVVFFTGEFVVRKHKYHHWYVVVDAARGQVISSGSNSNIHNAQVLLGVKNI